MNLLDYDRKTCGRQCLPLLGLKQIKKNEFISNKFI